MGLDSRGVVLSSGSLPPALLARGAGWGCFHRGGGEVKARGRMEGRVVELRGVERNGERRRDAEVNIGIVLFFTWRSAETLKLLVGSFLCSFKDEQIQRNNTHTLPAIRESICIAIRISLGVSICRLMLMPNAQVGRDGARERPHTLGGERGQPNLPPGAPAANKQIIIHHDDVGDKGGLSLSSPRPAGRGLSLLTPFYWKRPKVVEDWRVTLQHFHEKQEFSCFVFNILRALKPCYRRKYEVKKKLGPNRLLDF